MAGGNLTTGDNNIEIGNDAVANESGVIRIGTRRVQNKTFIAGISKTTVSGGVTVVVNTNGQLGVMTSSARYKEAILSLEPVTFRYRKEFDPAAVPQFGLIAEQVAKVDPGLVARDKEGKPYTVRYEAVNAMLLNEFLKEHRKLTEQGEELAALKRTVAELKTTISKVSARQEAGTPPSRVVENR